MEGNNEITEFKESGMLFQFNTYTIQYDKTDYYKEYIGKLEGTKAVDFISLVDRSDGFKNICLMEVKNFTVVDKSIVERIKPEGSDPIHVEIAAKVRDTLAGLVGASTRLNQNCTKELQPFVNELRYVDSNKNSLVVIAFVEGKLSGYKQGHRDGIEGLKRKLSKTFKWIDCKVFVLNIDLVRNNKVGWVDVAML